MSIILIRHGETALNAARVLQPVNTPLSDRGRRQAHAVAQRLAAMRVAAILSSDLTRAMQTAESIAAATQRDIEQSVLLQERNFGDLRGRAYDDLDFDPLTMQEAPPAGESMAQFHERVRRAMVLLRETHAAKQGTLVVVAHGLVIRAMLHQHLRMPLGVAAPEDVANTSVTIFAPQPPHQASLVNNTDHLDGSSRSDARALSGL